MSCTTPSVQAVVLNPVTELHLGAAHPISIKCHLCGEFGFAIVSGTAGRDLGRMARPRAAKRRLFAERVPYRYPGDHRARVRPQTSRQRSSGSNLLLEDTVAFKGAWRRRVPLVCKAQQAVGAPPGFLRIACSAWSRSATYSIWSLDSASLAFFAHGKLKKIAISGGVVQPLGRAPTGDA